MIFKNIVQYILLALLLVFCSCNSAIKKQPNALAVTADTITNTYAQGFKIMKNEDRLTLIEVRNPWQKAENKTFSYILANNKPKGFSNTENALFVQTPVKSVICMSTTHIAYMAAINELNCIKGISGASLVNNKAIYEAVKKGTIPDIGYEQNINYEKVVSLKPDVVFAYGVGAEVSGYLERFRTLGVPVVLVGEYLENHPLAKAEWIKFFAAFFNNPEKANIIFDSIANDYNAVKNLAQQNKIQPTVISTLPWNGTWYISGGETYMGRLIYDAGGNYIWKQIAARESLPMDYETVFEKSLDADIWINLSSVETKNDILANDARLAAFSAFKNNRLFNNNARTNATEGNDYWESGTMAPHLLLRDLVSIFHPQILPNHKLVYYRKVE